MTSLQLFPPLDVSAPREPAEWGSGRQREDNNIWIPKSPNWHYVDGPTRQEYALTKLKLSNLRLNDQLLPRPQDVDMGKIMIDKPFPAEHPYSSHIPRYAVFPKFDSPDDPKRGSEARGTMSDNSEMPRAATELKVLKKTKGNPHRIELLTTAKEGKNPLEWHDGDTYEHLIKTPTNNQRQFYPTPPKIYVPNHETRDNSKVLHGDMTLPPRTATALRNLERDQWETTYKRAHTGLGPANPNKLDNQDEKDQARQMGQEHSDELHPLSTPTFEPARPYEGRVARLRDPDPEPQTNNFRNPPSDPNYVRKPTLSEIEEDRLWNGKEYVNLPEGEYQQADQMAVQQEFLNSSFMEAELENTNLATDEHPLQSARDQQHDEIQQMEAENRWRLLESQTPAHNLVARNIKMDMAVDKTQPSVFYNHEGKYQQERSGLYKTSYDPYKLQYDMNKEEQRGGHLFDLTGYQKDVLNHHYELNDAMHDAMRYGRSLGGPPGSVPQLHDQPTPYEAFQPYKVTREIQKNILQPQVQPSDVRTVENGLILKETTMNDGYNHQKFLQENDIHQPARREPLVLMSDENQTLKNVKVASTPKTGKVKLEKMTLGGKDSTRRLASAPGVIYENDNLHVDRRPETSPAPRPVIRTTESARRSMSFLNKPSRSPKNQFLSRSSSFSNDHNLRHSWAGESPYRSQFTPNSSGLSGYLDLGYKNDSRYDWQPGSGTPRPQTSLLQIQDSFTKSGIRKKFHRDFPEMNPDLRENIVSGRKHDFDSFNAQVLRGAILAS